MPAVVLMNELNEINYLSSKIREAMRTIQFIQEEYALLAEYKDSHIRLHIRLFKERYGTKL
jgi:hypothetical protein